MVQSPTRPVNASRQKPEIQEVNSDYTPDGKLNRTRSSISAVASVTEIGSVAMKPGRASSVVGLPKMVTICGLTDTFAIE